MDKSILLQKQVRDNSEDLQKELRDMRAWEEQMKKKDLEIRTMQDNNQVLPPIRSRKKKKTVPETSTNDVAPTQSKRIAGNDYKAWDQFDVDKACKEVDADSKEEETEKVYEIPSKEELEKEHAEANELKQEGNNFFKNKEYAKAIGKYSQAIKIFPGDATYYANRAICQLKIDK